ncbi:DUF3592 domain-containing protein [Streptomyces sp. NPDC001691]|uniref:DUF3592 domain-containing protein n=1 Tax=unclassified Streptomyces TaxID=2593676 RepID=UPI000DEA1A03|nr:DUF3592 domain-containing protein [Streptomyces sp. SDr-06]RCH69707.1 hypothetical protein DT019_07450 [Streptomyces sp. SDr-06]
MVFVLAGFTVLGGLVALLAGAYGLRESRRVQRAGAFAWALVKPAPQGAERPLLQFETDEGHVLELPSPVPPSRREPLPPGSTVRVSYDPADPRTVVVLGRERTAVDRAFVAAGAAIVLLGLTLAAAAL